MPDPTLEPLTEADLAVIQKAVAELRSEGLPRDPSIPGCLTAFVGMALLTLTPAVGGYVSIPRPVIMTIFLVAVALLFVGAGVGIFGRGASPRDAAVARAEASVGPILAWSSGDGGREAALEASVALLVSARHPAPAGLRPSYDPAAMAGRLGEGGLRLVRAVERSLLERDQGVVPVFHHRA